MELKTKRILKQFVLQKTTEVCYALAIILAVLIVGTAYFSFINYLACEGVLTSGVEDEICDDGFEVLWVGFILLFCLIVFGVILSLFLRAIWNGFVRWIEENWSKATMVVNKQYYPTPVKKKRGRPKNES